MILFKFQVEAARERDSDFTIELICSEDLGSIVSILNSTLPNGRTTISPGKVWHAPVRTLQTANYLNVNSSDERFRLNATATDSIRDGIGENIKKRKFSIVRSGEITCLSNSDLVRGPTQHSKSSVYSYISTNLAAEAAIKRETVNVYGVIVYMRSPQPTRNDFMMQITIKDSTWSLDEDGLKV